VQELGQEFEQEVPNEEDRDVALRWVDASDSMSFGADPEEVVGPKEDYFRVALLGDVLGDKTGQGDSSRSESGSSLQNKAGLEPDLPQQGSSWGSMEKEATDQEVACDPGVAYEETNHSTQMPAACLDGSNAAGESERMHPNAMQGQEDVAAARLKRFCANIIKALAPPSPRS
jgi:hypothetical protein